MIALLSASWDEISQLKKELNFTPGDIEDLDYIFGELNGQELVVAITGVGIKRARTTTSSVIQKFKPRLIIFAGFGGALSPDLKLGDIVLGSSVASLKKNEELPLYDKFSIPHENCLKGKLLTESRFICDPDEKKRLYESSGALTVDMETWGVLEAAQQSKTPVASVRAVSDQAGELLPDMAQIYGPDGEIDSDKAEYYFKSYPELLSPYLKFRFTNTHIASESLGGFLIKLVNNI